MKLTSRRPVMFVLPLPFLSRTRFDDIYTEILHFMGIGTLRFDTMATHWGMDAEVAE